jgi:hypothetical protein
MCEENKNTVTNSKRQVVVSEWNEKVSHKSLNMVVKIFFFSVLDREGKIC